MYPARGGPLPIELVNTVFAQRGEARDALAHTDGLDQWLRANALTLPEPPSPALLERFRDLRLAVRELLMATLEHRAPEAAAVAHVNAASAAAPQFAQLTLEDDALRMISAELADPATCALAAVARQAIALVTGPDRGRIATCGAPGCVLFFLKDRRSAAWCCAACGNRARVARHYYRNAGPRDSPRGD